MKNTRHLGICAEQHACQYLQTQGLQLQARNYRCRGGEIDLIMLHGQQLVFVEVRYRSHTRFGGGVESIDSRKQQRIILCARHYLQQHPVERQRSARFDVISMDARQQIQWIRNAFEA